MQAVVAPGGSEQRSEHYEYDVFISYRHVKHDRKWAKWLLNALETYRTPASLADQDLSRRKLRVFRDESELASSPDLGERVRHALEGSRFLVVVCSPDTPASRWVEEEIKAFKQLGRAGRILALLVDGEPLESFPTELTKGPATGGPDDGELTHIEPLAADVRPRADESRRQVKRMALLRVLAPVLGVAFDDLWQRERRRQQRRRKLTAAFVVPLLAALMAFAIDRWDRTRLKTAYFAGVVDHEGAAVGVGPLESFRGRNQTYRLDSRGGRLERLVVVNGLGLPTDGAGDGTRTHDIQLP